MAQEKFIIEQFSANFSIDKTNMPYPSILRCYDNAPLSLEHENTTHYGFVLSGKITVETKGLKAEIRENCFFSLTKYVKFFGNAKAVLFSRIGYIGLNTISGPIENFGRLMYIDTCSTTPLVGPIKMGDPCLHHLLFPPKVKQSLHSHPSKRFGLVNKGSGQCILSEKNMSLTEGDVFFIPRNVSHCFHSGPEGLEVITYHPDSNTGPTDEYHSMKSATYLNK